MERNLPYGARFAQLHRAFRRQMDEAVKEFGLTGVQFGVLAQLRRLSRRGEENINQTMLENAAHVTHATMTELLKKLEKKGFIAISTDERDRRSKRIVPTEKCTQLREKVGQFDERIFSQICQGLSDSDIAQLLRMTDLMLKNAKLITTDEKGDENT